MRWRSTLLIVIFVFAILFTLIYVSSSSNIQALVEKNEVAIEELQSTARVYVDIAVMMQPTDRICFSADQNFLEKFPSVAQGMREIDELAAAEYSSDNNYYASIGLNLDKRQVALLLRGYQGYNVATTNYTTPNNLFTYEQYGYSCNFAYNEKYYRISIMFEMLELIHRDVGYVPIHINEDSVAEKDDNQSSSMLVTFAPVNNTLVFYNELSLPVTVQLASEDAIGVQPATIPPNQMRDFRLPVTWSTLENSTYHYQVLEYPWIEGDIVTSPKYTSECMDSKTAKSLYLHSDLDVKFPSYLPQGFSSACNAEIFESHLVQIYVNQTAVDFYRENRIEHSSHNPYPFMLFGSMPENETMGIIQVHALRHYNEDPNQILQNDYERMLNDTSANPEFFESDSVTYLVFNQNALSIVEVATDQEQYRIIGMAPREQVLRIAQSLFQLSQ